MRVAEPAVQRVVTKAPVASKMSAVPVDVNSSPSRLSSMFFLMTCTPAGVSSASL